MSLTDKYRPTEWEQVIGNEDIVQKFKSALENKAHRCFVLSGDSGIGKTTLARIAASKLNCNKIDFFEFDAASHSGIDDVRTLMSGIHHKPFGDTRVFIIDECQRLSKQAWDVLLKPMEGDSPNYFFLCTTEPSKIPKTILTRCAMLKLSVLKPLQISKALLNIAQLEGLDTSICKAIGTQCGGSLRQAITMLETGIVDANIEEDGLPSAVLLARLLSKKDFDLAEVASLLGENKDESPESIRQVVRGYFTSCLLKSPTNKWFAYVLLEFEQPSIEQNKISDILLRVLKLNKKRESLG